MITIVDYKAGNLTSVRLAFEKLGCEAVVTGEPETVRRAARIVFPGVGAASSAMATLRRTGLDEALLEVVRRGVPFLGICLGAQIILEHSEEQGGVAGLGILSGTARRLTFSDFRVKVPHMGWNAVRPRVSHPLFAGLSGEDEFYFVHSYYPDPSDPDCRLAMTEYGGFEFSSAIGKGNVAAVQFHPEKSGRIGLRLLQNFVGWDGRC